MNPYTGDESVQHTVVEQTPFQQQQQPVQPIEFVDQNRGGDQFMPRMVPQVEDEHDSDLANSESQFGTQLIPYQEPRNQHFDKYAVGGNITQISTYNQTRTMTLLPMRSKRLTVSSQVGMGRPMAVPKATNYNTTTVGEGLPSPDGGAVGESQRPVNRPLSVLTVPNSFCSQTTMRMMLL